MVPDILHGHPSFRLRSSKQPPPPPPPPQNIQNYQAPKRHPRNDVEVIITFAKYAKEIGQCPNPVYGVLRPLAFALHPERGINRWHRG